MEIRQILSFTKIAQFESFSKAAASLGYSQSALTIQIQQLEKELDTKLFDRIGKKIILTPPGQRFLKYAHIIMSDINEANLALKEDTELSNALRIGVTDSICFYKLPPILQYFHEHYPKVNISIVINDTDALIDKMDSGEVDFIYILDQPCYNNNWIKELEVREKTVFVASPDSPLAKEKNLEFDTLLTQSFILPEAGSVHRRSLDNMLAARGYLFKPFLEISSIEFIQRMLHGSDFISYLPYFTVEEAVSHGYLSVLDVKDFSASMYRQIFYNQNKWKTREMAEFIRLAATLPEK
ncbi:LysR family transcriptional regulator [Pseudobutyrivibrio sp. MD2005]|uniref:LysR family transcriptional regulator n=1 Tax=Pseudobutyrivibrio sp. MD2005 TaxID=1410616 RepID=UPI000489AD04|nr:LysR family transcriptional regulator [Pseudobutyrivibrio sp. MD2005]